MNVKKRYVALLMVVSMFLGAAATYAGVQLAEFRSDVADKSADNGSVTQNGESPTDTDDPVEEGPQEGGLEDLLPSEEFSKILQAYSLISEEFVHDMDSTDLVEGAIEGMVEKLEDPYSVYMDKETMEQFADSIGSSFEGIGAEVSMVEGKVTIVAPFKESPAEKAGLKPNDQIISVDGESLEGLNLFDAVNKIRGEKGTTVTLEVLRAGVSEPLEIDVVRDEIPIETVYSEIKEVDGKKAGVIEITSFSEKTAQEFSTQLKELEDQGIEGLVIDVRGNPGGLFTTVQDIVQHFITNEMPYVQIEDRNGKVDKYFSKNSKPKDYPVNILINEGSASASEILAAAFREAGNFELIGTTSFGKGTVQQTIPLGDDGSTLKLTLFKWLTPEGNWIHEKGVEPTIKVEQPEYFYSNPIPKDEVVNEQSSEDKVKNVQIMLKGIGFTPGNTDGEFDNGTKKAIEDFQRDQGLDVTGEVNKETAVKLEDTIVEMARDPKNDLQMKKALEVLFQ
ncbi:S41 family peptidase [Bacillaceae bacterium S4-13-56]